ncbi:MAG: trypsin-like peptidase domain-containing protein [Candidatus Chisholmbacteria bacterium]|nr:trypsin-like peptidase domain-containing protein [Candidatus Chisholmbacteria bacterium]
MKRFWLGFAVALVLVTSALSGAIADRLFIIKPLDRFFPREGFRTSPGIFEQQVLKEESVVISVAEAASPSVVTVSITQERQVLEPFFLDPFGFFSVPRQGRQETVQQDIGSGFIVDGGLVITNKHVVADANASYKVITKDDQEHGVQKIYRDPVNDIAILQVEGGDTLQALALGNSDDLKVGQFVIAIGTALGEFRHTVTTGVVSGLGRGVSAGDPFGGFVEQLDNVIQTDAAINPGNSGGPLLNSAGQVIGVNVAVAGGAENIGFAIPINVLKESLTNFEETGRFDRAFLGVRYRMIPKETALLNDVPEGAYIVEVVEGSAADTAGVEEGDIITKLDGKQLAEEGESLAEVISRKKAGDEIEIEYFRDGETKTGKTRLESSGE